MIKSSNKLSPISSKKISAKKLKLKSSISPKYNNYGCSKCCKIQSVKNIQPKKAVNTRKTFDR